MKKLFYIVNIITMILAFLCGCYIFTLGYILGVKYYMLAGILLETIVILCAIQHEKMNKEKEIQKLQDNIIKKLNKLCEE